MGKKNCVQNQEPVVRGFFDGEKWVEVTFEGNSALVPYSIFASDNRTVLKELSLRGLTIVLKGARDSLFDQVSVLKSFPHRLIFARPGWHGGQFANASGDVFSPEGITKAGVAFAPRPMKCASKGDHAGWLREVCEPLVGHPIPMFFVMAGLAAPLLDLVQRPDNFGYELAGEGGQGKSTAQRLMASLVGPAMEKDRGYISTFLTTTVGLEKVMQWHADMPLIIDEANLAPIGSQTRVDRRLIDTTFMLASGTTKLRADTTEQESYRFIYVISANEPFHKLLSATHRNIADAATDRLMTIMVPKGDAGVFGPLRDKYETYAQFARALEEGMARQFGTAMPRFLKALVNDRHDDEDGLRAKVRKSIDFFKRRVGVNDNNGSDVRVAEAFGLVYAAGKFAVSRGVLPSDFDCLGAARHCYTNFRNSVPVRQAFADRLLAIVASPQTLRIDHRKLPKLNKKRMEEAGAIVRRGKRATVLLLTPAFRRKMFPDWKRLKDTSEFKDLVRTQPSDPSGGYRCTVRAGSESDWFYAFELPEGPSKTKR